MSNEIISQGHEDQPGGHQGLGGREYLWFALFLIVVLAGVAGH